MAPASPFTVALVGPEIEENLSLRYLASSLQEAGFRADLYRLDGGADVVPVLRAILAAEPRPDVVALSLAFQWRAQDSLALGVALREGGYAGHVTAGGHFASFAWAEILGEFKELDTICRFESEETLVALASAVRDGAPLRDVEGTALRGPQGEPIATPVRPAPDIACLPWPDRRGDPAACLGFPIAAMIGGRGCYANCAFCCIAAFHEAARDGERFRLRPIRDVADEMADLWHRLGRRIFIFHDDNFFVPGERACLERIEGLADALGARGVGRFATVVKARPTDVTGPVFRVMRDRLGLCRAFLGVETNAVQGLRTLRRGVTPARNEAAMAVLRELGIYVCFNMLAFDPDSTPDGLEINLSFMERHADCPCNFGRVELYAGTPLLERMQAEGKTRGDWLAWDYRIAEPRAERAFRLAMRAFHARNFSDTALANRMQSTRFDVEVLRHFLPERFEADLLDEARAPSRALTADSVAGVREILGFVARDAPVSAETAFVADLSARLRAVEQGIEARAANLGQRVRVLAGATCEHARPRGTRPAILSQEVRP